MLVRLMVLVSFITLGQVGAFSQNSVQAKDYRVLATSKTSTMQKELTEAAQEGFRLETIRSGLSKSGGTEVIAIVSRDVAGSHSKRYEYQLLATKRTGTMQKELQEAGDAGFEYRDQTAFDGSLGGREVVVILEKDNEAKPVRYAYKLLATARTSTMQNELQETAAEGFDFVGMTIANASWAGEELITILRKPIN